MFTPQRSSTPIVHYRSFNGRSIGALGRARWYCDDEPTFDCLEFHSDDITCLETTRLSHSFAA
jgi:hypothetical protein